MLACAACETRNGILLDAKLAQALTHLLPAHAAYAVIGEALQLFVLWGKLRERTAEVGPSAARLLLKIALFVLLTKAYCALEWGGLRPGDSVGEWAAGLWRSQRAVAIGLCAYALPLLLSLPLCLLPGLSTWCAPRSRPMQRARCRCSSLHPPLHSPMPWPHHPPRPTARLSRAGCATSSAGR